MLHDFIRYKSWDATHGKQHSTCISNILGMNTWPDHMYTVTSLLGMFWFNLKREKARISGLFAETKINAQ